MKKNKFRALASAILAACMIAAGAAGSSDTAAAYNRSEFAASYSPDTTMRGLTPFQIASDMGPGWNLGNTLESAYSETMWGNPTTTKAMIDVIASKGFTTLRVPVRWDDHYSDAASYTISPEWLDRVETVVNYGLANGMYVIINVHHNDSQTMVKTDSATKSKVKAELSATWKQVAERFKKYGDHLIFETVNEPRSGEDWNGNDSLYAVVNEYNEAARAAIRATGGNNSSRLVMMPTYCASGDEAKVRGWKNSSGDKNVAVSIHAYLPFDFAFTATGHKNWLSSDEASLAEFFDRMKTVFIDKGVAVIIGEFGAVDKGSVADRVTYVREYARLARQFAEQDIPCCIWDNNVYATSGENFGLFNRRELDFSYGDGKDLSSIVTAFTNAYKGDPVAETSVPGSTEWFSGSAGSSNWSQALTLAAGCVTGLQKGQSLKARYSGGKPELILQSWSAPSSIWCKVAPSSTSGGVATWTYDDLYNAYSKYTQPFGYLDKVYVGDTGASMTVTSVYTDSGTAHTHKYGGSSVQTLAPTATTMGRRVTYCSVSGCSACKVELVPRTDQRFVDVSDSAWYASAVEFVSDRGVMNGTSSTTFSPSGKVTRGQIVTMLWNLSGQPKVSGNGGFTDVETGKYYTAPVAWASKNEIVSGYGNGKFGPGDVVTRQDFIVIIRNYVRNLGINAAVSDASAYRKCSDYKSVSGYALSAVQWGFENGFIGANGKLSPKAGITRAEAAAVLERLIKKYEL